MKDKQYQNEVQKRWGQTKAYTESSRKLTQYTKEDWKAIQEEAADIYASFFALKGTDLSANRAREVVVRWKQHICAHYYECSDVMLAGLGEMYAADERFRHNIDQNGEGTAQIMAEAIAAYYSTCSLQ